MAQLIIIAAASFYPTTSSQPDSSPDLCKLIGLVIWWLSCVNHADVC